MDKFPLFTGEIPRKSEMTFVRLMTIENKYSMLDRFQLASHRISPPNYSSNT
jgi:hypothetical protein